MTYVREIRFLFNLPKYGEELAISSVYRTTTSLPYAVVTEADCDGVGESDYICTVELRDDGWALCEEGSYTGWHDRGGDLFIDRLIEFLNTNKHPQLP